MTVFEASVVWRAVIEVIAKGPRDRSAGICENLYTTSPVGMARLTVKTFNGILRECYSTWAMYSGTAAYPVPGEVGETPGYAYYTADDKWRDDAYGRRRQALLRHIQAVALSVMHSDNPEQR